MRRFVPRSAARVVGAGAAAVVLAAACTSCAASVEHTIKEKIRDRAEQVQGSLEYLGDHPTGDSTEQRIRAGELYMDLALHGSEPASDSPAGPPTDVVYDLSTDEQGVVSVSFLLADQSTGSVGLFGSETRALIACMTLTADSEGRTRGSSAECPDYVDTLYSAYRQVTVKP
jgi:hypothetical protein